MQFCCKKNSLNLFKVGGSFFNVIALVCAFIFAVTVAVAGAFAVAVAGAFDFAFAIAVTAAVAGSVAAAGSIAIAVEGSVTFAFAISVTFAFAISVTFAFVGNDEFVSTATVLSAIIGAVIGLAFSLFIGWRVVREDVNFDLLRLVGLKLASMGGTSFCGANLTEATFYQARLKSANFSDSLQRETVVTHVCWQGAIKVNRAQIGKTILQDCRVRSLLIMPERGYQQDLTDANLRGANLKGVTLEKAILRRAILSEALLEKAVLKDAVLTEVQAVSTDFTRACLTGATLESWHTDSTTTFKNIDCQYVFLREQPDSIGSRERRPYSPDKVFQSGDFEKFFKEMLDEVQLLIRDGIHLTAFRAAFQSIMQHNPAITPNAITGYEKRGTDVMLTLRVPENVNKADIERAWEQGYQTGLKAGRDAEKIASVDFLQEALLLYAGKKITFNSENKLMTGNDQSQNIDVTGNFTVTSNNSVVSLRDTSGQVSNQLAQLSGEPTQTQLKDLLTQLQNAIETELSLSEEQKADALEEVKNLATAGQALKDGSMKKAAKRAITTLKGMTVGADAATKFVESCNRFLPAIALLFGC